jgi:hypothetical protein
MTVDSRAPAGTLSRLTRRWVLTAHIIVSVGLLGDSAGFLAVAVRSSTTHDPQLADAGWQLLEMFGLVFGIPLSLAALTTGLILGLDRIGECSATHGSPPSCCCSSR